MENGSKSHYYDAGSSLLIENSPRYHSAEQYSCEEFCVKHRSAVHEDAHYSDTNSEQRFSYVHSWRQKIVTLELSPPSSPLAVSNFPGSPVAFVTPDQLSVTSVPPYDLRTAALLTTGGKSSASELNTHSIVDRPTHFYDLYDAELEEMINDLEASSASSSTNTMVLHLPPVRTTQDALQKPPRRTFSSSPFRWLPTRIKYSFLSSRLHKVLRR